MNPFFGRFITFSVLFFSGTSLTPVHAFTFEDGEIRLTWVPVSKSPILPQKTLLSQGVDPGTIWGLHAPDLSPRSSTHKLRLTNEGPKLLKSQNPGTLRLTQYRPLDLGIGQKGPEFLDLEDMPGAILDHPTGLLVFCNGDLFRFRPMKTSPAQWIKEILVKRIDLGNDVPQARLFLARDGSIRLALAPGKVHLRGLDNSEVWQRGQGALIRIGHDGTGLDLFNELGNDPFGGGLVWTSYGEPYLAKINPADKAFAEKTQGPCVLVPLFPGMAPGLATPQLKQKAWLLDKSSLKDGVENQELLWESPRGDLLLGTLDQVDEALHISGTIQTLRGPSQGPRRILSGLHGVWELSETPNPTTKAPDIRFAFFGQYGPTEITIPPLEPIRLEQLSTLGPKELARAFLDATSSQSWLLWDQIHARISRQKQLAPNQSPPIVVALREAIKGTNNTVSFNDNRAIQVLSCFEAAGDKDSLSLIHEWAESASALPRSFALSALGKVTPPEDTVGYQILLNALSDSDLRIKSAAVKALGMVPFPGSANTLASAFSFDLGNNAEWTTALVSSMNRLGKPAYERIKDLAESGTPGDLKKTISFLGQTEDPAAFSALLGLLNYPHLSSQDQALLLRAIRLEEDRVAAGKLLHWITTQDNPGAEVVQIALEKLEGTTVQGEPEVLALLIRLLKSKDSEMRWLALAKLKKLVRPGALDLLEKIQQGGAIPIEQRKALAEAIQTQKGNREGANPP